MPICIPDKLPARATLEQEGVAIMDEDAARRQDIRPLRIGLLNLMPDKIRTETQIARLIGATPLQVEMTLVRIGGHQPKNTTQEHLLSFYRTWDDVSASKFDGFIITGAPVELLDYEDVTYWEELTRILDWTSSHVHSSFFICWGAMAAVSHFYGIPKHKLATKASGVFRHQNLSPSSPYLSGFSDDFAIPVSRWTEVRRSDIESHSNLSILMESDETGPCLISDSHYRRLYMFNHIEYDSTSLAEEYERDLSKSDSVTLPANYFLDDNPTNTPLNRWRSHAHLLFGNWINQTYQTTPYEIELIGT